ncbi:hypothetical protein M0R45_026776 [Rubus argutus]|uniref:Uncharacterized protein n=1 Tax=Rubus argutus TaxID=59490 RepID=A0AAW1X099_RUBAR
MVVSCCHCKSLFMKKKTEELVSYGPRAGFTADTTPLWIPPPPNSPLLYSEFSQSDFNLSANHSVFDLAYPLLLFLSTYGSLPCISSHHH